MTDLVLVDTGPLVALHRRNDAHHERCKEAARHLPERVFTCWPVITEAAYILRDRPDSVQSLLTECARGRFTILSLTSADIPPIAAILHQYQDIGPQLADAALLHLANREGAGLIFTLDRRDFLFFRDGQNRPLQLVPQTT
jgi:predicted nucleic acid-binding protein